MADPDILLETRGRLGLVTLNRPQALNALTIAMVEACAPQLRAWAADPAIAAVAIRGAGGRAFCAGGDIRNLHDIGRAGRIDEAVAFWRTEYTLNAFIKNFPKPYIALIEGVVMGGGVGVSIHGSHRIGAETITFATPEVGIGLFPDVGATYFLPRLPRRVGTWLALTGARLGLADACALGIVTHHVPAARFDAVIAALAEGEAVDAVLARAAREAGAAEVTSKLPTIERLFSGDSVEAILAALDAEAQGLHEQDGRDAAFAAEAAAQIRTKSPTSLKLALEQMKRGVDASFAECMRIEFRLASRILDGPDFFEGVRAVVLDKDNAPNWKPSRLEDVSDADIARFFAPLGNDELLLPQDRPEYRK